MSETHTPPKNQLARKIMIDLSIMTVIGVGLALIGPFGSFQEPLSYRLVSWVGFAYLGYVIYSPMGSVVARLHAALELPAAGLWIAAVLVATIPMTAAVWSIGYLPRAVPMPSLEDALTSYFYVLVIGGGITALFHALETQKTKTEAADVTSTAALEPAQLAQDARASEPTIKFLNRLPPALGTYLLALEMEDHYVRAHTALGSELILLRMRDAVAELDGVEGAQVHRSWWVARQAVEGTRRDGRNIRLKLNGGLEAPVSRNAAPQLKGLGWF